MQPTFHSYFSFHIQLQPWVNLGLSLVIVSCARDKASMRTNDLSSLLRCALQSGFGQGPCMQEGLHGQHSGGGGMGMAGFMQSHPSLPMGMGGYQVRCAGCLSVLRGFKMFSLAGGRMQGRRACLEGRPDFQGSYNAICKAGDLCF